MAYQSIPLVDELHIEEIFTVHYFEYCNDFHFTGEKHDFWEFQCVDVGSARVCADDNSYILKQGQIIFHKPNEFHTLTAMGKTPPNIVVVSFSCHSPLMSFFEKRILEISDTERRLIAMIVAEARNCIASPLDNPYMQKMEKRADCPLGSQQLIRLYLEQLLIYMVRRNTSAHPRISPDNGSSLLNDSAVYTKIVLYLKEHIREFLSIEAICRDNLIGRSQLQKLFCEHNQCGVINFFNRMKIDYARHLMRENQMNFTQISDYLGYSSIHYFSRQFKQVTGMTPSEYSTSIMRLSEQEHPFPPDVKKGR